MSNEMRRLLKFNIVYSSLLFIDLIKMKSICDQGYIVYIHMGTPISWRGGVYSTVSHADRYSVTRIWDLVTKQFARQHDQVVAADSHRAPRQPSDCGLIRHYRIYIRERTLGWAQN